MLFQGKPQAAIAVYEEIDKRFRNDPDTRWMVASVLFQKGNALATQGKKKAAIASHKELLKRYGDDDDELMKVLIGKVNMALERLGE